MWEQPAENLNHNDRCSIPDLKPGPPVYKCRALSIKQGGYMESVYQQRAKDEYIYRMNPK
jgi:hypothetical protein